MSAKLHMAGTRERLAAKLRKARLCLGAGVLLLAMIAGTRLPAQQVQATEAQVKAAFLFNFGKYVTWPRPADDHFLLCILGRDPFGASIDSIAAGEKIAGKPMEVRRIQSTDEGASCHILFIPASEEGRIRPALDRMATVPVLTVSDARHFASRGGMIEFVNEGDRVRFVINRDAAQKAGLSLSSELLKVAKAVQGTDEAVK